MTQYPGGQGAEGGGDQCPGLPASGGHCLPACLFDKIGESISESLYIYIAVGVLFLVAGWLVWWVSISYLHIIICGNIKPKPWALVFMVFPWMGWFSNLIGHFVTLGQNEGHF